jgi:hypothetical protein
MRSAILLVIALTAGAGASSEYARTLSSSALDQTAFDAETYGEKAALKREADGLRMTLAPGQAETGWKTPQQIRFGGDFTITATAVIKTLPKPAQEDGAALGRSRSRTSTSQMLLCCGCASRKDQTSTGSSTSLR